MMTKYIKKLTNVQQIKISFLLINPILFLLDECKVRLDLFVLLPIAALISYCICLQKERS